MRDKSNDRLLKFNSQDVSMFFNYELNAPRRIIEALRIVKKHIPCVTYTQGIDLNKSIWREGKNYDWLGMQHQNIYFLFRRYGTHISIYHLQENERTQTYNKGTKDEHEFVTVKFKSGFSTFYVNSYLLPENRRDSDFYYENELHEVNPLLPKIIEHVEQDKYYLVDNSASIEVPKWLEVKQVYEVQSGSYGTYHRKDLTIFAMEELGRVECEIIAENVMPKLLDQYSVGDLFGGKEIVSINKITKDDYYHDMGIEVRDESTFSKTSFHDVYSLTRYYEDKFDWSILKEVYPENTYIDL